MQAEALIEVANNSADSFCEAAHLYAEIGERVMLHLDPISIKPTRIVDLGTGLGTMLPLLNKRYPKAEIIGVDSAQQRLALVKNKGLFKKPFQLIEASAEQLPFDDNSVSIVVANLMLHWVNDLGALFNEVKRVLSEEGLFIFSYYGPDTLKELQPAQAFIDMHDLGDDLIRLQMSDPILDSEQITVEYDNISDALADLTANGEIALLNSEATYSQDDEVELTYEIVYGHAWKSAKPMTSKIDQDGMVRIDTSQIQRKT